MLWERRGKGNAHGGGIESLNSMKPLLRKWPLIDGQWDSETVDGVLVCGKSLPGGMNSQYKCPGLGVPCQLEEQLEDQLKMWAFAQNVLGRV